MPRKSLFGKGILVVMLVFAMAVMVSCDRNTRCRMAVNGRHTWERDWNWDWSSGAYIRRCLNCHMLDRR